MITKQHVYDVLAEAERSFRSCWATLATIALRRISSNQTATSLLDFEPKLAVAIYEMHQLYYALYAESDL